VQRRFGAYNPWSASVADMASVGGNCDGACVRFSSLHRWCFISHTPIPLQLTQHIDTNILDPQKLRCPHHVYPVHHCGAPSVTVVHQEQISILFTDKNYRFSFACRRLSLYARIVRTRIRKMRHDTVMDMGMNNGFVGKEGSQLRWLNSFRFVGLRGSCKTSTSVDISQ